MHVLELVLNPLDLLIFFFTNFVSTGPGRGPCLTFHFE